MDNLQKTRAAESSEQAKKLVVDIVTSFERNMNNDLNVKAAFDDLFKVVSKLSTLKSQGKLSAEDTSIAVANLQKIDRVLQIIF